MPSHHQPLEIEVKFYLPEPESIRRRLIGMGAGAGQEVFETNARYEDKDHSLRRKGCLLRLRQDSACRLTYKCPPETESTEFKIYHELEVTVSDSRGMDAILSALGFQAVQVYEKWRQSFSLDDVQICVDTMPFGCFLEIEGSESAIRASAAALGFSWEERILMNYLAIFQYLREKYQWTFKDLTFSNFTGLAFDIADCLPHLYTGHASHRKEPL